MAEGHRGRCRDRFENESIDTIPEYVVLEKMLHGVIVRQDTGDLARALISEFGSLAGVIDAPAEELQKIKGAGPAAVTFIKSFPAVYERFCKSLAEDGVPFVSDEGILEYLRESCKNIEPEQFILLCLNGEMEFISIKKITLEPKKISSSDAKRVLDYAVASKATELIIAHKCEGDIAHIQGWEKRLNKLIYNTLDLFAVHFKDHVIVSENDGLSMKASNMIPRIPKEK